MKLAEIEFETKSAAVTDKPPFELKDLLPVLPHRPPFLFVDRVTKLAPNISIVAERLLRPDEPQFAGHFPGRPIMPGVLAAEALGQTSGLLIGLSECLTAPAMPLKPKAFMLATTNLKFTHPAVPGDLLILRAESNRHFAGLFRFNVEATAGRNLIVSGSLTLALVGRAGDSIAPGGAP